MAMQNTPLLMANILDRGAKVAPNEEIVTATENGVRRQTYKKPAIVLINWLMHRLRPASRWVIVWVRLCGTARGT